jgi:ribosomal protein S13
VSGIGKVQSQRLCWQVGLNISGKIDHLSQEEVKEKLCVHGAGVSRLARTVWSCAF